VSQHRQADQKPVPRYKPYKGPAGGWGALISVAQAWLTSDNALKNLRIMRVGRFSGKGHGDVLRERR
jgi:hypothetical protein